MTDIVTSYGGDATLEKLDAIERYGDAYTTALKNTEFTLHYIDAFAGSGIVRIKEGAAAEQIVPGSAIRALDINDRPFDRLLFIERNTGNVAALKRIVDERGDDNRVEVVQGDANEHLRRFCVGLRRYEQRMHRALVFVDPFGTQVNWTTVEALAESERCDVLMLIPLMAVRRLVKRDGFPDEQHAVALTRIFGDEEAWRNLYTHTDGGAFSAPGFREIVQLYVKRLETVFVRVVDPERTLGASSDRSMFTLLFAASNERGATVAARIAKGVFDAAQGAQRRMRL